MNGILRSLLWNHDLNWQKSSGQDYWVLETKHLELEAGQQSATAFIFRNDENGGGSSKRNRLSHLKCVFLPPILRINLVSPGTWSWGWPCGRRSPWIRSPSRRCRGRGSSQRSWAPRQRAAEQNTIWDKSFLIVDQQWILETDIILAPSNWCQYVLACNKRRHDSQ